MKNLIMGTLTILLVSSCATNSALKKHEDTMRKEVNEVKQMQMDMKEVMKKELREELKSDLKAEILSQGKEELVVEMKNEVFKEAKKELDTYKEVISKVIAEKLVEHKGYIREEIQKALIEGPFIPMLEEKIKDGLADQQESMFSSKKEDFIKECVERALDELEGKEIGIGAKGAEILK